MKRFSCAVLVASLLVALMAAPSLGAPIVDKFSGQWLNDGFSSINENEYGNTGYNGPWDCWYEYPSGWWAQWYYDHPYDETRWKQIHVVGQITGQNDTAGTVAVNWTKPEYSDDILVPNHGEKPPIPPISGYYEDKYIQREVILPWMDLEALVPIQIDMWVEVPDYNPEWVSIEIIGAPEGTILFNGTISHDCIPEPSTLVLLGIGVLGLLGYTWRRRRA